MLIGLYLWQAWHIWEINRHVFCEEVPELHRYDFRQVVALDIAYFATFGSELAVVSMLPLAVGLTMLCSFFVQSGEGAAFAMVPLIKRRLTGQIAGQVGAYGNVGAVTFLTVLSFVSPQTFFLVIGAAGVLALIATWFFLKEPEGHMAEVLPDGTVELIDVK